MRLYDAYRRGYITYSIYIEMLSNGYTADSTYTPTSPAPIPPVPDDGVGTTTNIPVLAYTLDVNTVTAYSVKIANVGITNSLNFRIDRIVGDEVIESISDYVIPLDTFYMNFSAAVDTIYVYVWSKVTNLTTDYVVGGSVTY